MRIPSWLFESVKVVFCTGENSDGKHLRSEHYKFIIPSQVGKE